MVTLSCKIQKKVPGSVRLGVVQSYLEIYHSETKSKAFREICPKFGFKDTNEVIVSSVK